MDTSGENLGLGIVGWMVWDCGRREFWQQGRMEGCVRFKGDDGERQGYGGAGGPVAHVKAGGVLEANSLGLLGECPLPEAGGSVFVIQDRQSADGAIFH